MDNNRILSTTDTWQKIIVPGEPELVRVKPSCPPPMNRLDEKTLFQRGISQTGNPSKILNSQSKIQPANSTKSNQLPGSEPLRPEQPEKLQPENQCRKLWQQLIKRGILERLIPHKYRADHYNTLLNKLNKITLPVREKVKQVASIYMNSNSGIQSFDHDIKQLTLYLDIWTRNISPQRTVEMIRFLAEVRDLIHSYTNIQINLTHLSKKSYTLRISDSEIKDCNENIYIAYGKDHITRASQGISDSFSKDLFRGMNVSIFYPTGKLTLGVYAKSGTCLYIKQTERGEVSSFMSFNIDDNSSDSNKLNSLKAEFLAKLGDGLKNIFHNENLTHIVSFLCSQRPANTLTCLFNTCFFGNDLLVSLPEREFHTELQLRNDGKVSVHFKLYLPRYSLIDIRSNTDMKYHIEQSVEISAVFLISNDSHELPGFNLVNIEIHELNSVRQIDI